MLALKIIIIAYIADDCVECIFYDANFQEHTIHTSAELFELDANSNYPEEGLIVCRYMGMYERDGKYIVKIDTANTWGIFTIEDECEFEVLLDDLVEID